MLGSEFECALEDGRERRVVVWCIDSEVFEEAEDFGRGTQAERDLEEVVRGERRVIEEKGVELLGVPVALFAGLEKFYHSVYDRFGGVADGNGGAVAERGE